MMSSVSPTQGLISAHRHKSLGTRLVSASKVVHIMLTIFTIMLILYAQKILLLCSKSPTIMLKTFSRITNLLRKIKYNCLIWLYGGLYRQHIYSYWSRQVMSGFLWWCHCWALVYISYYLYFSTGIPISRLYLFRCIYLFIFDIFSYFLLLCWHNARCSCLTIMLKIMPA